MSRRLRARTIGGGVLLALAGACHPANENGAGPSPSARELPTADPVVHLLEHLDLATIDAAHAKEVAGELGPPSPRNRLLDDEPHGAALAAEWIDAAQALSAGPGSGGTTRIRFVAAPGEETLLVRARMRGQGWLGYLPLREPPPAPGAELESLKRLSADVKVTLRRAALADGAKGAGRDWQELTLLSRPYPERKSLLIVVASEKGGADVDSIEVRRLTPAEALGAVPDETVEKSTHPLRRQIELDLTTVDTLALPAPGRASWRLRVPVSAPRLTLMSGAKVDAGGASIALAVTIDGESIARRDFEIDATTRARPFEPWRVDLARFAGREVELSLVAEGPAASVALFGAPTLLSSCAPRHDDASAPPRNLLLVSLDTLRADAVGCYGATSAETPALDGLAAAGTRFADVLTPVSWTLPAHVTLLSGQHPLVHETVKATLPVDPLRTAMLQQRLRAAGRATAAFTAGGLLHARYGFGPGFDSYSMKDPSGVVGLHRRIGDAPDRDAAAGEDRMEPVLAWLGERRDVPFFLFVHTYLVHNYRPKAAWMKDGKAPPTLEEAGALRAAATKGDAAAIARMRELYGWSASEADAEIVGRLLATLDRLGLAANTLVVVVADHGEEFREHGALGHGHDLYGEATRVPWIVRGPGVARGAVRDERATLVDVAPTIAALMKLPADPRVLGVDRSAAAPAPADPLPGDDSRTVVLSLRDVAGQADRDALIAWPWKLIRVRLKTGDVDRLFDVATDPGETNDLFANQPQRVVQLGRLLEARIRQIEQSGAALPRTGGDRRFQMSSELERMLDELGYGRK